MDTDATGAGGLSPLVARAISIAGFFALWWLASLALGTRLCPDPLTVFVFLGREILSGELPYHMAITLARVAAAFVIAIERKSVG